MRGGKSYTDVPLLAKCMLSFWNSNVDTLFWLVYETALPIHTMNCMHVLKFYKNYMSHVQDAVRAPTLARPLPLQLSSAHSKSRHCICARLCCL